jgi:hypothetical protein
MSDEREDLSSFLGGAYCRTSIFSSSCRRAHCIRIRVCFPALASTIMATIMAIQRAATANREGHEVRAEVDFGSYTIYLHARECSFSRQVSHAHGHLSDHKSWLQFNTATIGSTKPTLTAVLRISYWETKLAAGGLIS